MIVKMRFLNISGPRDDIDRVCEKYLSKYEMQIENAVTELKTTENIMPFVEVNPYRDPLAKASIKRTGDRAACAPWQSSSHSFCRRTGKFGQICQDQRMICWR